MLHDCATQVQPSSLAAHLVYAACVPLAVVGVADGQVDHDVADHPGGEDYGQDVGVHSERASGRLAGLMASGRGCERPLAANNIKLF